MPSSHGALLHHCCGISLDIPVARDVTYLSYFMTRFESLVTVDWLRLLLMSVKVHRYSHTVDRLVYTHSVACLGSRKEDMGWNGGERGNSFVSHGNVIKLSKTF